MWEMREGKKREGVWRDGGDKLHKGTARTRNLVTRPELLCMGNRSVRNEDASDCDGR